MQAETARVAVHAVRPCLDCARRAGELEPPPLATYASRVTICPNCGHENEPAAKFCSQCAKPLAEEPKGPRTERKIVTVLYRDRCSKLSRCARMLQSARL
ncbi:MAG: zinc-ribbon domain-containing protein [Gaiellaceae bacterium]